MIRPATARDRDAVQEILAADSHFHAEEIEVGMELLDEALEGEDGGYLFYVAEEDGAVRGLLCIGPTPMTDGAWDLYWIAVAPSGRGRGLGRALVDHAATEAAKRGGRVIRLETSSAESHGAAVRLYGRAGWTPAGKVADFYRPGEDLLIWSKSLV